MFVMFSSLASAEKLETQKGEPYLVDSAVELFVYISGVRVEQGVNPGTIMIGGHVGMAPNMGGLFDRHQQKVFSKNKSMGFHIRARD
jgi:hypothetical protein